MIAEAPVSWPDVANNLIWWAGFAVVIWLWSRNA